MNTLLNTNLTWLAPYQHPDGGVAYLPGRLPRIEPTVYTLLAGASRSEDISWLHSLMPPTLLTESTDSTTDPTTQIDDRPWLVAAGIVALAHRSQHQFKIQACTKYLRASHAVDADAIRDNKKEFLSELELAGALPWNNGNYGWIQPTCWAVFAELTLLSQTNKKSEQELLLNNLSARIDYLLSRKTVDQGWNYGNTTVIGVDLTAHPLETAMVLTAIGGIKNSQIASYLLFTKFNPNPSFEILERLIQQEGSRLTRSWFQLALDCWQRQSDIAFDITPNPPTIGESAIDALLAQIATSNQSKQQLQFLHRGDQP